MIGKYGERGVQEVGGGKTPPGERKQHRKNFWEGKK